MGYLIDSNNLLRLAVRRLKRRGERLCILSQNLAEFRRTRILERRFELLPDGPDVHRGWRRLLVSRGVSGVQVYDAHIAAAMQVHGVENILTFRVRDFVRYPDVTPVHPTDA